MRLSAETLRERAERLTKRLGSCDLCPRVCGANRLADERGFCGVGRQAPLAAALPHFGEEPPISGERGSGTFFFGGCNLRCVYCQNRQISSLTIPVHEVGVDQLASEILRVADSGCHNISFVTGSHVVPQILSALAIARAAGFERPIVWNSSGYDAVAILRELEGVVDIYLPDLKYSACQPADELSHAADYWDRAREAIREMVRQVGELRLDARSIATRGVVVRHLVLPNDLSGSEAVIDFLATLSPRPALSLLAQFYPIPECGHPLLQRTLFAGEYERVRAHVEEAGFVGWTQELDAESHYRPDFSRANPFSAPAV